VSQESFKTPTRYPVALDADWGHVHFVRLDEVGYRDASFLDERLLERAGPGYWVAWTELMQALPPPTRECDFIFHIGHVGSTLVSRLLDQSPLIFGLREPAILRTLAWAELDGLDSATLAEKTSIFLQLWSRTWCRKQKALVKATSFAAEIAPLLMGLHTTSRAVLMYVSPSVYIASILASDASRAESRFNAPKRLSRLHRRLGLEAWRLSDMTEGETIAMSWISEMLSLVQSADLFPRRVMWLDFENYLLDPEAQLSASLKHLHGEAPPGDIAAMISSPVLGRYSKSPDFPYDAALRKKILGQAEKAHAFQIRQGMNWLTDGARSHVRFGDALDVALQAG
jgi:hypothetical protein